LRSRSGSGGHRACAVKLRGASCERFRLAPCRPSGCFYPERHEPTSSQNLAGAVRQARRLHGDDMVRLARQARALRRRPECLRSQTGAADRRSDQAVRDGDKPQRLPGSLHRMRRTDLRCARRSDARAGPPMGQLVNDAPTPRRFTARASAQGCDSLRPCVADWHSSSSLPRLRWLSPVLTSAIGNQ
jgi:hypothetical protein